MRKLLVLGVAVLGAIVIAGGASLAVGYVPAKKPPVKLEGKVANKGSKTVKHGKIEIEADDFYFKPTFIKAKPGTTVTVELKNEGKAQHTFTIPSLGIDKTLDPDQKASIQVAVPKGALGFYCRFHGPNGTQGDRGMQGAVYTKKGQAVAVSGTSPAASAATVKVANSKLGQILVDANGKTLYQLDPDTATMTNCTGGCAGLWPPLTVTGQPVGGSGIDASKLTTLNDPNGTQVVYAGHPLFTFSRDNAPGDLNGQGFANNMWHVIAPSGQLITSPVPAGNTPPPSSAASSGSGY